MLQKGLRDYLVKEYPVNTGVNATAFRTAQVVGDLSVLDRDDARRYIRNEIGDQVHAGRVKSDTNATTVVTLRRISTDRLDVLTGGTPMANSVIQVDVRTRDPGAALRGEKVATLIRLACEGFRAGTWGSVDIKGCEVVREAELWDEPKQGSTWDYRYSMDLHVYYGQASALIR